MDEAQVILTKYSVELCSSLNGVALCKVKYMWGQAKPNFSSLTIVSTILYKCPFMRCYNQFSS